MGCLSLLFVERFDIFKKLKVEITQVRNPVIRGKFLEGILTVLKKKKKKASNSRLVVLFLHLQFC